MLTIIKKILKKMWEYFQDPVVIYDSRQENNRKNFKVYILSRSKTNTHDVFVLNWSKKKASGYFRLPPRHDLRNHSPDGFDWGYPGSGPAQLALAILADFFDDDTAAIKYYQDFKRDIISKIETDVYLIMDTQIGQYLFKKANPYYKEGRRR